jgi:hypothetical protein
MEYVIEPERECDWYHDWKKALDWRHQVMVLLAAQLELACSAASLDLVPVLTGAGYLPWHWN